MKHARSDYARFQDPATICWKHGLPVGEWKGGPGYVTAPDGTTFGIDGTTFGIDGDSSDPHRDDTNPPSFRLASAIAELLSCEPHTNGIPENEPVFLLRGQDVAAPATLRYWAGTVEEYGADATIVDAARHQAENMVQWSAPHEGKVPDMPPVKS